MLIRKKKFNGDLYNPAFFLQAISEKTSNHVNISFWIFYDTDTKSYYTKIVLRIFFLEILQF